MQERKEFSSEPVGDETEDEEREIDENQSEEEDAKVQEINRNRQEKDEEQECEERENEDEPRHQENEQIGECAICHITINDANLGGSIAEQNPHSAEGYLLCQCCVRKFAIRSGQ